MLSLFKVTATTARPGRVWGLSLLLCTSLLTLPTAQAQDMPDNTNCCGAVSLAGQLLLAKLDQSGVDKLWLPGLKVDWRTGQPDPADKPGKTHCSAFVAAFLAQQNIYILRPPEHSAKLLANAQMTWLDSEAASAQGWRQLSSMQAAQAQANLGKIVVAVYANPNPDKPGHIAIVRPALLSVSELHQSGPRITQAGYHNYLSTDLKTGFARHRGAWPEEIRYFAHTP